MKRTKSKKTAVKGGSQSFVKRLIKDFGSEVIWTPGADDIYHRPVEVIAVSSKSVGWMLGRGGLPRSRMMMLFGPESSGKTTLAQAFIADVQKRGGRAALVDVEHTVDLEYMAKSGVDISPDQLIIAQPEAAEDAFTIMVSMIESGVLDLIVLDSVAFLTPKAELEGRMADRNIGLLSLTVSRGVKKLKNALRQNSRTCILFINQMRDNLAVVGGPMYGPQYTIPGGRALKHACSIIVQLKKGKPIRRGTKDLGFECVMKTTKNKVAPPFRKAIVPLIFNVGIDSERDYVELAVSSGAIKRRGIEYFLKGKKIAKGWRSAYKTMKGKKMIAAFVEKRIDEYLERQGTANVDE